MVNISSTGGRIGGVHNTTVYSGTKGGMLAMTKSLARHYAPYNILVNAIAPGAVDTRMFENVQADGGVLSAQATAIFGTTDTL